MLFADIILFFIHKIYFLREKPLLKNTLTKNTLFSNGWDMPLPTKQNFEE